MTLETSEERPASAMLRLIFGYQISQAIHVAATLGLADLLRDRPRASDELATLTGAHPGALYRLLRALASIGVFQEHAERQFGLTPLGACLRSDAPEPVGPLAAFIGRPAHWQAHAHLLDSVLTGENAFQHLHGVDVWTYRATHPEEGAVFDGATTANSRRQVQVVLAAYDFGRFGCVVDVGGGQGTFLAALLARNAGLRGVLFDQPWVVAAARHGFEAAGVADRCHIVAGSFFDEVPAAGDAYVLKSILHDWDDAEATAILRVCRRSMSSAGPLLVLERIIAPPNEGSFEKFSDLQMLVSPGGRERTREEFAALFAAAGFRLTTVTPTASELGIIEAVPLVRAERDSAASGRA